MHEWIATHCFAGRGSSSSIWASLPSISQVSPYISILLPALQGQCMLSLCLYSTGNFNLTRGGRREVGVGGISNESSGFPASSNWIWIKSFPCLPDLRGPVQEVSEIFGELDEAQFCLDWHLVDQVTSWRGLHTRAPYHCSQRGSHHLLQRVSWSLWGNQPSWHGRASLWM